MYNNYQISDYDFDTKAWIDKYPFLRIKDASCTYYPENTDEFCWLNDIPLGWVKGFGKEMCDKLLEALGKYVNDFIIIQLKEKYGAIRLYWRWDDKDYSDAEREELNQLADTIQGIIKDYEVISEHTCYSCGSMEARKTYGAWIIPRCKNCNKQVIGCGKICSPFIF
jgi:hypothetical protein